MTTVATCPKCKEPVMPHRACKNCGTYAGRETVSQERAIRRTAKKTLPKTPAPVAEAHDHAGHDHDHDHEEAPKKKGTAKKA